MPPEQSLEVLKQLADKFEVREISNVVLEDSRFPTPRNFLCMPQTKYYMLFWPIMVEKSGVVQLNRPHEWHGFYTNVTR